jgi:uncharacterized protein YbcI
VKIAGLRSSHPLRSCRPLGLRFEVRQAFHKYPASERWSSAATKLLRLVIRSNAGLPRHREQARAVRSAGCPTWLVDGRSAPGSMQRHAGPAQPHDGGNGLGHSWARSKSFFPAVMSTQLEDRPRELSSTDHSRVLAEISSACVRLHKRFHGKGPVRARADLWGDVLAVVLEGGFTRAEQTLQERGHAQEVVDARLAMRASIEGEIRAAVETILACPMRSYMIATDPAERLQVEVFLLQRPIP